MVDNLTTIWYTYLMSVAFTVVVDPQLDVAVYAQIAGQIRRRIATGEIPPGTSLPPVRVIAVDLGVNMNTVARAYRMLEEEGFLRIHQRAGAEVVVPSQRTAGPDRTEPLREELAAALARLRQAGVGVAALRRWIDRELALLAGRR
jgi:GntR family transcriptional regulator